MKNNHSKEADLKEKGQNKMSNSTPKRTFSEEELDSLIYSHFEYKRMLEEIPEDKFVDRVKRSLSSTQQKHFWPWWLSWGGGSLGAVVAIALAILMLPSPATDPKQVLPDGGIRPDNHLRARGGDAPPLLLVVRKRGKTPRSVPSGALFKENDKIRLATRWSQDGFVYIVHQSADSKLSPLYPDSKKKPSIPIKAGKQQALPKGFTITGTPEGDEWIWACFSSKALTYKKVIEVLRRKQKAKKMNYRPCIRTQLFRLTRMEKNR